MAAKKQKDTSLHDSPVSVTRRMPHAQMLAIWMLPMQRMLPKCNCNNLARTALMVQLMNSDRCKVL